MTLLATEKTFALDDNALDLIFRAARTANTFTDEPVSVEEIRAIYEFMKFGPTAMNIQPMRLLLVEPGVGRERLGPHMNGNNREKTLNAPMVAVLAIDPEFHERLVDHFPHAPGARESFADDTHRFDQARFNAALQIGYFIVGVRAAGLAAGPMAGFDAAGIDREFFEETGWKSQLVINIGHPGEDAWFDRLPRLAWDDAAMTV